VEDIPVIRVVNLGGEYFTLDNRRLWVFRKLEKLGGCDYIEVCVVTHVSDVDLSKFTTDNDGETTFVRGGAGGTYWRELQGERRKERKQKKWEQEQQELAYKLNRATAAIPQPTPRVNITTGLCRSEIQTRSSVIEPRQRTDVHYSSQHRPDAHCSTAITTRQISQPVKTLSSCSDHVTHSISPSSSPFRAQWSDTAADPVATSKFTSTNQSSSSQKIDHVTQAQRTPHMTHETSDRSAGDSGVLARIYNGFKRWLNL
jgi:hypothetical protein